jgi:SNF2 family DNA or RNA helicase
LHILQGTWIPGSSPDQPASFFLWGEHAETSDLINLDTSELDNVLQAAIGTEHALVFKFKNVRASLSSTRSDLDGVEVSADFGTMSDLLHFLITFDQYKFWKDWGYAIGDTLSFWHRAARLSLELLASQHFVPGLNPESTSGVWDAMLHGPSIEHQLRQLSEQQPELPLESGDGFSSLRHFVKSNVDAFVREQFNAAEARDVMRGMNSRYIAPLKPSEHWLQSLLSPVDEAEDPYLDWIAEDVASWRDTIIEQQKQASFRTCFRLEEPSGSNDSTKPDVWRLSLMLQAADDPSLLVPAERVWREAEETADYQGYRFHQPQERLLADLWKASKLFYPLKTVLEQPCPTLCELSTDEAHLFLKSGSQALRKQGFGIYIPAWWRDPKSQLGVTMKLKPKSRDAFDPEAGHSNNRYRANRIGFDAIVNYEWELALGEDRLTREDFEQLASAKMPLIQVRGQWVEFQPQYTEEALRLLDDSGSMKLSEAMHLALAQENDGDGHMELPVRGKTVLPFRDIAAEGAIGAMIHSLRDDQQMAFLEQPGELAGSLRPYQLKGLSWMFYMRRIGLGACLADDMGLGKTIQWIAYLLTVKDHDELDGPVLLICPTSVMGNWQKELERFAPSLRVWVHYGGDRLKGEALAEKAAASDIILTSYAITMRDEADLSAISWDVVTLDEAQNIKNTSAKQTQAIRKLSAFHRIALTGTPVENRLAELWSIMDFLNSGYLGSKDQFIRKFETPIERDGESESLRILHKIVQPFILRRLKSDRKVIEDIPDKYEGKIYCSLTREQAALYEACVNNAFQKMEKAAGMERRGTILSTITQLKQICNHPAHYLGEGELTESRSGKLIRLVTMLQDVFDRGEKTLVFTQYAQLAVMLQSFLMQRFKKEILLIHGRVPKHKRDEMIRRFQEDEDAPDVFVLSLKTGGLGLNLTRANHVIHFDRWWNPAVENQATDRAYRIGQERNVEVHKFLCAGTLEEKIDQMIENKQSLAAKVIGKGEAWITELSTDDLKQLFMLRNEVLIPADDDYIPL